MDPKMAILQTIIDNIPGAVTLFDGRLRMIACNRQLIKLLDFPEQMFAGELPTMEEMARYNAWRGEYGPGDPEAIVAEFMARARNPHPHHFIRSRPDGTVLDIRGAPLPDGGFVTIYTDITELKASQRELERTVTYLRSVVDHLPQGISVFDETLHLKCWNRGFVEVLRLPDEAVHTDVSFDDLIAIPARRGEYGPGDVAGMVAARRALAMKFEAHRFERTRPDGRTHLVEGRPMKSGESIIGFVTSYTDITDRKQVELELQRQNAMLQALVDNMPGGVSVFDANLKLALVNAEALRLLGFDEALAASKPSFEDVIRFNAERGEYGTVDVEQIVSQMLERARKPVPHRFERVRPDGLVVEVRGAPLPGGGFVTIYIDVTQRRQTEDELRRRNQIFQTLIDNIPGGVTLFDKEFNLVAHNAEYRRLLEFPDELFDGQPTLERFFRYNAERGEYGDGPVDEKVAELLALAGQMQPHVFERTRPNGITLEIRGLPLPDGGFVTIYTDITEKKSAAEAIERLAHRDTLTGLSNRYNLEARLDQVLADAMRQKTHVALLYFDMDRFKTINDTLGHASGDCFLIEVAGRLTANVRESDIVARLGGDEFVVVICDLVDFAQLDAVIDKIVETLAEPLYLGERKLVPSASVGVAVFPEDAQDRELLLRNADIAMYQAKNAGRGRVQRYTAAMSEIEMERTRLEVDLRQALDNREFFLHFQPQVARDGKWIIGYEALIRWRRADGKLVPPATFIPIAEDCGMIDAIGEWVLEAACRAAQSWEADDGSVLRMAVNLSARQLTSPRIVEIVRETLSRTGFPATALELEVTETAAMDNPQLTVNHLRALRELGVSLAIDDFGTGYSSLAYLKLLPIQRLKLDRTFVKEIETDTNDAAICAATISLAHSLGLQVVAEGVETRAQFDYLAGLGCDEMQGYWFSRPIPEASVRDFELAPIETR